MGYRERVVKALRAFVSIAALAACSGDDAHDHADAGVNCALVMEGQDTYTPGLAKVGANGYTGALMEATPAPPAKGDNVWRALITDPSQAPVDGLDVEVKTWMPLHNHGSPIRAESTPAGAPGEYTLDPVNLFMPGIWEVTLQPTLGDTLLDEMLFTFCIDG
jgi:hypothetical protein